jgi:hypothetical protein
MGILTDNIKVISTKKASNPIDVLIFEKGLRIIDIHLNKKLDILLLVLNNGTVIKSSLTPFKTLKKASQKNLDNWKLISKGIGIEWTDLDEHLSLRGFLDSFINNSLLNPHEYNYAMSA